MCGSEEQLWANVNQHSLDRPAIGFNWLKQTSRIRHKMTHEKLPLTPDNPDKPIPR